MTLTKDYIRNLLKVMGFTVSDGRTELWEKKYSQHNDYFIQVNFDSQEIIYETGKKEDCILVPNKTSSNFSHEENFVMLECVNRLLERGYKPNALELEHSWPSGHGTSGRLDIWIKKDNNSYLMIECKTYGKEFNKEKNNLIHPNRNGESKGQLLAYFWEENKTTEYLCLYASILQDNDIKFENAIIPIEETWKSLSNKKELFHYWNKTFKKNGIFEPHIKPYNIECKALLRRDLEKITGDDSSRIFNQFLEILRHNVISDKPNAFNKILNLFICKIIDEDRNDDEELQFQWKDDSTYISLQSNLEELYKQGMDRFLDIEVTDYSEADIEKNLVLIDSKSKAIIKKMFQELRLQKSPEFAFKDVYNQESFEENAKVLKEIVQLLQPYQFRYGHKQQFLGNFFEQLLNTSIKQESGQFFTPVPIARFMISSLPVKEIIDKNIQENKKDFLPVAIDYACGSGHFLTEYMDIIQLIINNYDTTKLKKSVKNTIEKWKQTDNEEDLQGEFEWAKIYVYGIDKDYRLAKTTKISTFLNGDGEAIIIHADGLDKFSSEKYKGLLSSSIKENGNFDILIANPPYSVSAFKQTLSANQDDFETYDLLTENSSEIECLFVERASQLLREGGCAAIILPSSLLTNTNNITEKTREILLKNFFINAIAKMGRNTFMASDASTVILFLQKRKSTDYKIIRNLIEDFFTTYTDFTYNGVSGVISRYTVESFEDVSLEDYISYVQNKPHDTFKATEYYKDLEKLFINSKEYKDTKKKKAFRDLNVIDQEKEIYKLFKEYIKRIESEKLLYYLLTFEQKTLLIDTGEKQEEKDFLGYEFSSRRGYEGIHPYKDETGCINSMLYDEEELNTNSTKTNYYIQQSFIGEYKDIPEELSKHISVTNSTASLIEFKGVNFTNIIYIKPREYILNSKYPQIKLENLVKMPIVRGKSAQYGNSSIQIIKSGQIRGGYDFDLEEKFYVSNNFISDERNLQYEDILINSTGVGTAGRVNIFQLEGDYVVDSHVSIVRLDKDKVLPEYVLYALTSIGFKNIESLATGQSGQVELSTPMINKIRIPVPPKAVQQQIINENKAFYEQIIKNKKDIEVNQQQKQDIVNSIYSKGYPEKSLGDKNLLVMKRGPFGGSLKKEIFVSSGYKVYEQKHAVNNDFSIGRYYIKEEKFKEMQAFEVLPNDIIMSCSGTIGRFALAPLDVKPGIINQALLRFRAKDNILPQYLLLILEYIASVFQNKSHGKGLQNITSVDTLETIKIPVPEDKEEQQKILNEVKHYTDKIVTLENKIRDFEEKQKLLQQKYL